MTNSMTRIPLALFLSLLAACAHSKAVPKDLSGSRYQIGREDILDVSVWRDADLSRVVPVRPDGMISLPLVGELVAVGRTADDLAKEIAQKLGPYVQEPRVVVIVREVNSPKVYVLGEVAHPGAFPLKGRMTVLQALALAGGPNEFASRSQIVVLRGAQAERYEVDYTELVSTEQADFPLAAGDTIYVP